MIQKKRKTLVWQAARIVVGDRVPLHFSSEVNSHSFYAGFSDSLSVNGTPCQ
jgi:hypothetical protein